MALLPVAVNNIRGLVLSITQVMFQLNPRADTNPQYSLESHDVNFEYCPLLSKWTFAEGIGQRSASNERAIMVSEPATRR